MSGYSELVRAVTGLPVKKNWQLVTDQDIAALEEPVTMENGQTYPGLVVGLVNRFIRNIKESGRTDVLLTYDDLLQEARYKAFRLKSEGIDPSSAYGNRAIQNHLRDYLRTVKKNEDFETYLIETDDLFYAA